jgi:4-amino-4-deoxy-L-arabinose transferase-like glycosyltransferase
LGILYYIPIWIMVKIHGVTLLALRLSSAFFGVLTVPLLYWMVRRFFGVAAASVAAWLFVFDQLHIGWSRTDIHPHGVTVWPALLVCLR